MPQSGITIKKLPATHLEAALQMVGKTTREQFGSGYETKNKNNQ